ncbi:unnamed protein product, partial [Allacma fusca]
MEVLAKISPDLRAKEYVDLTAMAENPVQRVLGLIWNPSTDEFKFKLNFHKVPEDVVDGVKLPTKRQVLSLMMSIFDPLGFIAHLVIKVKILFQFIWRSGLGWDDSLTQALGERWRKWLKLLEGWPSEIKCEDGTDEEMKSDFIFVITSPEINKFSLLPDVTRFSKWRRLIQATAYVRRAGKARFGAISSPSKIQVEDVAWAEILWWQKVQSDSFGEEIQLLSRKQELSPKSKLYKLSVFMDEDGVLRVQGRTAKSPELQYSAKCPVVLDPKHLFTELLLLDFHERAAHQGKETVVNEVKQRYWIFTLRAAVKKAFFCCYFCRRKKARAVPPLMGNLPKARVERQIRPFVQPRGNEKVRSKSYPFVEALNKTIDLTVSSSSEDESDEGDSSGEDETSAEDVFIANTMIIDEDESCEDDSSGDDSSEEESGEDDVFTANTTIIRKNGLAHPSSEYPGPSRGKPSNNAKNRDDKALSSRKTNVQNSKDPKRRLERLKQE